MTGTGESKTVLLSSGKTLTVQDKSADDTVADDPDKVATEIVPNLWGSCAGVGSDFLDKYQKGRTAEMARIEEMDKKWREEMENKLFQSQRNHRIKKELEKLQKRKQKRERKKKKSVRQIQPDPDSDKKNGVDLNSKGPKPQFDGNNPDHDRNSCGSSHPGLGMPELNGRASSDDATTPKSEKDSNLVIRDLSEDEL